MKKLIKLITHDGSFHADDIFACAVLILMLEARDLRKSDIRNADVRLPQKQTFEITRTRDKEIIDSANKDENYVFDVGGIYDEAHNRFDHHQPGGAGEREGIPYAAFGLVWHKFGRQVSGTQEIARLIEKKLVMSVDANDNAVDLYKNNFPDILPYTLQDVLATFAPSSLEDLNKDEQFLKALVWAKEILTREIKKTKDQIELTKIIRGFYEKAEDKRLIVIDKPKVSRFEIWDALGGCNEPLFVVYGDNLDWSVVAMRKARDSFGNKKDFPANWGGLYHEDLAKITGVADAVFCHRGLFLAVAKSKEGAVKLAQIALES